MLREHATRSFAFLDVGALLEFSRLLNDSGDPTVICNNLLLTLMGKLGVGRAAMALPDKHGTYKVSYTKGNLQGLTGMSIPWDPKQNHGLFSVAELSDTETRLALSEAGVSDVMPVTFSDIPFALVLLGPSMQQFSNPGERRLYALLMGATAAMALDGCATRDSLSKAHRRLERRIHRLRSLVEASTEFGVLLEHDAILRLLGFTLMGEMTITHFAVIFRTEDGFKASINRFDSLPEDRLIEYCIAHAPVLIGSDTSLMTDEERLLKESGIYAALTMSAQEGMEGLLLVGERLYQSFDEEDLEYVSLLANLAASTLENSRLLGEQLEKQRLEDELKIAAEIQQGLLPKTLPQLPRYEIAATTVPSRQIGGDCYDVIDLGSGRILVSIADVVGKGTPASLLMANMQAALRTLARIEMPLIEIVRRINDVIYENTSADKFITAFFGIIDSELHQIGYVNAGHNPPYLFHAHGGTPSELDRGGLILGIMPSDIITYDVGIVNLEEGDLLMLYTDGVSEALNVGHEEYGTDRLCANFDGNINALTAHSAIERLRRDVSTFVGEAPQSDDITVVALRRTA